MTSDSTLTLPAPLERFLAYIGEVQADSDRAAVLVAAAACEHALTGMLQAHGVSVSGPFQKLINRAAEHALIDPDTASALHTLRDLRNEAAHTHEPFDLVAREPQVRAILLKVRPVPGVPTLDAKRSFRWFAILAAGSLRLAATMKPRPAGLPAVSLRGVSESIAVLTKPPVLLLLFVGALLVFILQGSVPPVSGEGPTGGS
jgi:hypothetical protein